MLSGVGESAHLQQVGITPVHHLPGVGRNLRDHPYVHMVYECKQPELCFSVGDWTGTGTDTDTNTLALALARRVRRDWDSHKGGMGASNLMEAVLFARTSPEVAHPNIEVQQLPLRFALREGDGAQLLLPGITAIPTLVRPRSVGSLRLQSNNPGDPPLIDPNVFAVPADLDDMLSALHLVRTVFSQAALHDMVGEELTPGASVSSREGLIAFLRAHASLLFHPVGTCRMGDGDASRVGVAEHGKSASAELAQMQTHAQEHEFVLDTRLRVRGIAALRVVDASVFPSLPSGNTLAPTLMVAERAAEFILEDA